VGVAVGVVRRRAQQAFVVQPRCDCPQAGAGQVEVEDPLHHRTGHRVGLEDVQV
jgi:hypothetical protein